LSVSYGICGRSCWVSSVTGFRQGPLEGLQDAERVYEKTTTPDFVSYRILLLEALPVMFSKVILGNVDECRTECEIADDTANTVAVVYESREGWHVNIVRPLRDVELEAFDETVAAAKQRLSHYVNRMGGNASEDTTRGALSLWLMQRDDGTALGINLHNHNDRPAIPMRNVPPEVVDRIRSLSRNGQRLEAIRKLRLATNCSLEQAKAWLNDNC